MQQKDYWHRQDPKQPLYPDLLWSRPENKTQAGKLLIIGGNVQSFAAVGESYSEAIKAGVGTTRVLLPDALQKTVSKIFVGAQYAPSTPSGSFSREALAIALDNALWADAILLAGDFGRNSESSIMLEQLVRKYSGKVCLTKDAVEYFAGQATDLLNRQDTLLVLSFAQLQKLAVNAKFPKAFTFSMDLLRLVDTLHEFTEKFTGSIIVRHLDNILISTEGQVTSTKASTEQKIWRVETAAKATVWWLQNPNKRARGSNN